MGLKCNLTGHHGAGPAHGFSIPTVRMDLLKTFSAFSPLLMILTLISQTDFVTTAELSPESVLGGLTQLQAYYSIAE